jgi:MFS family permease
MGVTLLLVKMSLKKPLGTHTNDRETDEFYAFQRNFMLVFLLVSAADWFQGPYIYAIYHSYGLSIGDIGYLFLIGYLTSMICGPIVGVLADRLYVVFLYYFFF